MHLYRIMANVRAGADGANCRRGQPGLATIWVQSDSEQEALELAKAVVERRRYEAVGELTIFREETTHAGSADTEALGQTQGIAAGYIGMKQKAIERGDGLFELWYPTET